MEQLNIITHRCRGFGESENSFAALKKALRSGVDGVEIDIQITKEKKMVVSHNPTYRDAEGRRHIIRKESLSVAEKKGLMSLNRALTEFKKAGIGKILYIDIKRRGGEKRLVRMIKEKNLLRRVVIVSWISRALEDVHRLEPRLPLSFSFAPKIWTMNEGRLFWLAIRLPHIIRKQRVPISIVNLVPIIFPINRLLIWRLKRLGVKVVVVNVDLPEANKRLRRVGVYGTMTNRAELLLDHKNPLRVDF